MFAVSGQPKQPNYDIPLLTSPGEYLTPALLTLLRSPTAASTLG